MGKLVLMLLAGVLAVAVVAVAAWRWELRARPAHDEFSFPKAMPRTAGGT